MPDLYYDEGLEAFADNARIRSEMVQNQLQERGIRSPAVLAAMQAVPRELFVPSTERNQAYDDCALPLLYGQTISQPYMVARAAELAGLAPSDSVLEVGLGSGYQAAVLSRLCARVISLEIIAELTSVAARTLSQLGYDNVQVRTCDGSLGYAEAAPYDAIIVAAAAPAVPNALVEQLKLGGRLVIPVGSKTQKLSVITRTAQGARTATYDACVYVPLRGAAGRHD
jgi:protein-L-isoaspartate(D-aspartate) O-methyltransferase